jgi:hypothetical protein
MSIAGEAKFILIKVEKLAVEVRVNFLKSSSSLLERKESAPPSQFSLCSLFFLHLLPL